MKPAQLKGKMQVTIQGIPMYDGPDIRAAVEWFKEELNKQRMSGTGLSNAFVLINEAFEDVMKQKEGYRHER